MRTWLLVIAISLVPSFASASEIRVVAAGSLKDAFTAISADFIIYCSSARTMVDASQAYRLIELPPELSVGPEYGLTISRKAAPGAAEFAMYLLSPRGQATLKSYGFIPVTLPTE
jgi:ABC-type molybdate transport system substrate-binding protein